jgi:uncharacterized short protein YbdD (DUF466 family)
MTSLRARWRSAWEGLRALSGDDAYERYVRHRQARHPGEPVLDRSAFYRAELDRRFRQASRCC